MKKLLLSLSVVFTCGLSQAQVYFEENWDAPDSSWALYSLDTDTLNWGIFTTQAFPDAGAVALSQSWVQAGPLTPDNFIISPAINLSGVSSNIGLSFRIGSPETTASGWYEEYLSVYVSDGASQAAVAAALATPVYSDTLDAGEQLFVVTVDITALAAGKDSAMLWFRHHNCTDENFIVLDDISVYNNTASIESNTINTKVYPNPAKDVLNIAVEGDNAEVVISTLDGKIVLVENNKKINVSDLTAGMYIYKVKVDGKIATGNFVKN
jgi:hypothetical protein